PDRTEASRPGAARARPPGVSAHFAWTRGDSARRRRRQVLVLPPGAAAAHEFMVPDAAASFNDRCRGTVLLPARVSSHQAAAGAGKSGRAIRPGRFLRARTVDEKR